MSFVGRDDVSTSGDWSLRLAIEGSIFDFAGVFQDVEGISEGDTYEFSGWHATGSRTTPVYEGAEIRIEWRDSTSDTEVGRTPNYTQGTANGVFERFSLSGIAPAGADTARVVYAIQSFSAESWGKSFVDDVSLLKVEKNVPDQGVAFISFSCLVAIASLSPLRGRS